MLWFELCRTYDKNFTIPNLKMNHTAITINANDTKLLVLGHATAQLLRREAFLQHHRLNLHKVHRRVSCHCVVAHNVVNGRHDVFRRIRARAWDRRIIDNS